MAIRFWLFKTDPESFSLADLQNAPGKTTFWNGVRNFQARNYIRDKVKKEDRVLFYHSVVTPPFIAGTAVVVKNAYPDADQFESKSRYFDPTADRKNPRWYMVDICLDREFPHSVTLDEVREHPLLQKMVLLQKGSRLSIQPVTQEEWDVILKLGGVT